MSDIAILSPDDVETARRMFGLAFSEDPMYKWIMPDAEKRLSQTTQVNRLALEYGLRYGRATTVDSGKAVAVWLPPGKGVTVPRLIRTGMLALPFRAGVGAFLKFGQSMNAIDAIHRKHAPKTHYYLMLLGVHPDHQGRGIGSSLVNEGIALADKNRVACYTETSHPRNLPFYERHGFVIKEELRVAADSPPYWALLREPSEM